MRDYFVNNGQFFVLLIAWLVTGVLAAESAYLVIPISLLLLYRQGSLMEIFLGFIFILVLSDNLEDSARFAKLIKNVYIVLFALIALVEQRRQVVHPRIFRQFILFFLIAIICLFYSPVVSTAIQKTLSYILLFYAVPVFVIILYQRYGNDFFKNLVYFLITIVIICLLLRFYNHDLAISHGSRLRGIFGNPNGLGIFLILVFSLFFVLNHIKNDLFTVREKQVFYFIIMLCAFLTYSRTAIVAITMLILLSGLFRISVFLGLLLFITAAIFYSYIFDAFLYLVSSAGLNEDLRVESIKEGSGRFIAWQFAWENIQKSLLLGKGFSYDETLMRANYEYLSKLGHEGGVHNTYLIIWLNTGLIGLFFFMRGLFLSFIRAAKNTSLALPVMLAVMFSINFEPWLAASLNPFTILFLVILTIISDEEIVKGEVDA